MNKKHLLIALVILLATLFLAGCAAGANPTVDVADAAGKTAGFWSGLWHGVISPVTFIISLFTDKVNIYDVYNTGNWYDFGFMIGISIVLGSGAKGARRRSK